jgi:hypothetical protein
MTATASPFVVYTLGRASDDDLHVRGHAITPLLFLTFLYTERLGNF